MENDTAQNLENIKSYLLSLPPKEINKNRDEFNKVKYIIGEICRIADICKKQKIFILKEDEKLPKKKKEVNDNEIRKKSI